MNGEDRDLARILEPPSPPEGCPSDWTLQRFVTQELGGEQHEQLSIHLVSCDHCRERVARLDTEREEFLHHNPFEDVEANITERTIFLGDDPEVHVESPTRSRVRTLLVALTGGALAVLVAAIVVPRVMVQPDTGGDRIKGTTSLSAAVLRDGELVRGETDVTLRPGDEIQFRVDTGGYDHVVVVGVDGTGQVAVYQPVGGGRSLAVEPGAGQTLETAFRLDEAPGPEVYVAIFTDQPIETDRAVSAVESWAEAGGAEGVARSAPDRVLGGAVEVLAFDKEVPSR